MAKEFRALGVDPRRRGAITDAALAFLHECFERDEVEANGQRFLFRPRPPRPPILVGGAPPHSIRRAVRFGDGWMPTAMHADVLQSGIADLRAGMATAGKPAPEVVLLQSLPVDDEERLPARLGELAALGVTRVVHPWRYQNAEEVARVARHLVAARDASAPSA
jgi:alkanesulfonate monooxygenase SsuD/methylene tetrahydromethanopterin reductase-like flavin-dependent oxidoreductase (luciferase family)